MSELIEMTETVTDVHGFELRPGDQVEAVFDIDGLVWTGKVLHVTLPKGEIRQTDEGVTAEKPPVITVQFDNGKQISFEARFLRLSMWRWNCMDVKRT